MQRVLQNLAVAAALLSYASIAHANPLTLAHFGGLGGDPVYQGAYALYWNPAALAEPGWSVVVEGDLIARQASYDRDATLNHVPADLQAINSGRATIGGVGVVPGLIGRYGRRLANTGFDLGFGLGVFVDNGGSGSWNKNFHAPSDAPGALDGPQRWASISSSLTLINLGVAIALKHRRTGLSIGFTPALVIGHFSTVRARNIDSTEDIVDSNGAPKEGRAYFDGKGLGFSAIVGVRWDIKPGWALGLTYQRGVRIKLEGDLSVAFGSLAPSSQRAYLKLPIADTLRLAAALPATKWLTFRPYFEIAFWSILKNHVFTSAADHQQLLTIVRDSNDNFAGQLRADMRVCDKLIVMLGVGGEKSPTPQHAMEPGFGENNNIDVGIGAKVALSHHVDLAATFLYQYFLPYKVTDSVQKPTTNGTYTDQRELFIVDLEVHGWQNAVR